MARARVVILNDTDVDGYHFGCARVMSIIRKQLALRDLDVIGSVPVGLNWQDQHADLVGTADIAVINGEGTLHHGSRKGRWLLEAAQQVKARGGKVALINALWQENPADWADLIKDADILACRDSRSASGMGAQTGRDIRTMGDLSMCQPANTTAKNRHGLVFGDSVHASVTGGLADRAKQIPDASLVPVTRSLKFIAPSLTGLRRKARILYAAAKQRRYLSRNPAASFLPDEAAYLDMVSGKALSVTGRFHAACLAVATHTPFVAVRSNSWKIEALLEDIGLSPDRLQPLDALTPETLDVDRWAYTAKETANITAALARWQETSSTLFDDIAALAD